MPGTIAAASPSGILIKLSVYIRHECYTIRKQALSEVLVVLFIQECHMKNPFASQSYKTFQIDLKCAVVSRPHTHFNLFCPDTHHTYAYVCGYSLPIWQCGTGVCFLSSRWTCNSFTNEMKSEKLSIHLSAFLSDTALTRCRIPGCESLMIKSWIMTNPYYVL